MIKFDLPKDQSSIIKVIGVGGGGSNAVNHMFKQGINGVDFIVCNTDQQALDVSPVPVKIALGASLTKGRGAGSLPEVGKNSAIESIEEIKAILGNNTEMVFITAGMGGGTGTGAAPVIAKAAKEMGILTVGIVTVPFSFEGKKRKTQAEQGLSEMKQNVDTLLVISNDKLREIYGNLKVTEAFGHADDILTTAAKGIADIITTTLQINTDFADIRTVMKESGVAIMGSAQASGEGRAIKAVEMAMHSPLLNDSNIMGARYVLLNITCGTDQITMDELGEITDYIQDAAGQTADLIKGYGVDETLGDKVSVTIIATGFNANADLGIEMATKKPEKIVHTLEASTPVPEVFQTSLDVQVEEVKMETPIASKEISSEEPFLIVRNTEAQEEIIATVQNTELTSEENTSIEFEITNLIQTEETQFNFTAEEESPIESNAEMIVYPVAEPQQPTIISEVKEDSALISKIQEDDQKRKAQERIMKLKELSMKLKTPNGLAELEKEPAYKRKNVSLDSTPHSSESQVSRYTLVENEDKKIEIRPNNSFLHDNVD